MGNNQQRNSRQGGYSSTIIRISYRGTESFATDELNVILLAKETFSAFKLNTGANASMVPQKSTIKLERKGNSRFMLGENVCLPSGRWWGEYRDKPLMEDRTGYIHSKASHCNLCLIWWTCRNGNISIWSNFEVGPASYVWLGQMTFWVPYQTKYFLWFYAYLQVNFFLLNIFPLSKHLWSSAWSLQKESSLVCAVGNSHERGCHVGWVWHPRYLSEMDRHAFWCTIIATISDYVVCEEKILSQAYEWENLEQFSVELK